MITSVLSPLFPKEIIFYKYIEKLCEMVIFKDFTKTICVLVFHHYNEITEATDFMKGKGLLFSLTVVAQDHLASLIWPLRRMLECGHVSSQAL